jgi:hypothetical protein
MSEELATSIVQAAKKMKQNDQRYEIVTIQTHNKGFNFYDGKSKNCDSFDNVYNRLVENGYHLMPGTQGGEIVTALNSLGAGGAHGIQYVCVMQKELPPNPT